MSAAVIVAGSSGSTTSSPLVYTPVDVIAKDFDDLTRYFRTGATRSAEWREHQLDGVLEFIAAHDAAIKDALHRDLGKPTFESGLTELLGTATEARTTRAAVRQWMKPTRTSSPLLLAPAQSYIYHEPLGVVLIIVPFNYPFQLAISPLVAAISAGNAVVLKLCEQTPNTSALTQRLIESTIDHNAFRIIQGGPDETAAALKLPFNHIFFTGSEVVGKIVMKAAAEHLTPVTLELGGKSPVIIDATADLDTAARRIIWGKTVNCGQTCIAPDYAYVHSSVKPLLIQKMTARIRESLGENIQSSADYGRIVNEKHTARLKELIDAHQSDIISGGHVTINERYVEPTLLDIKDIHSAKIMSGEIFGPILPIIEYNNTSEVINYINSKPKPLSLYIFTNDQTQAEMIMSSTSSGSVLVNDVMMHFANENLPFGGVGSSGIGSYHGHYGFLTFSHERAVMKKPTWMDLPQRYAPYSDSNFAVLRLAAGMSSETWIGTVLSYICCCIL